ncbi:MAG: murein L,D-transpeptidase catalytic domain family protein [Cytophagaceae bacterium]
MTSFQVKKRSKIEEQNILTEKQQTFLSDSASICAYKACLKYVQLTNDSVDYLAVADFSLPSSVKRFYIYHLPTQTKVMTTYVTHGKHSGGDTTTSFSNRIHSGQTSLGLYKIEGTYVGCHGKSIYLNGLDKDFNDEAKERSIVMHTAPYAHPNTITELGRLGKSLGCPVLPEMDYNQVLEYLPNNALLFHYYPDHNYLTKSFWLR